MKFLLGMLVVLTFTQRAYSQKPVQWDGQYSYLANYGRNAAGTAMTVYYSLTVNKQGGPPDAILIGEGYQTNDTIYCNCTVRNDSAFFFFRTYGDGTMKNIYGVAEYRPDQWLFTLVRRTHKGAKQLLTIWGAFNSDDKETFAFSKVTK